MMKEHFSFTVDLLKRRIEMSYDKECAIDSMNKEIEALNGDISRVKGLSPESRIVLKDKVKELMGDRDKLKGEVK